MVHTKLFKNGSNQAVRIPKRWSFECEEVVMLRRGEELILRPKKDDWVELEALADDFDADFMPGGSEDLPIDEAINFS